MRRSVTFGLYSIVIAGLVGGTVAWAAVDKAVTLQVDGQQQSIHTLSGTVQGALSDAGYTISPHDIVAPSRTASVKDGGEIVLRRGRLLKLTVDGQEREVWTWSPTVSAALADLGYDSSAFTSVSRSKRLPLSPTEIDLRTPKHVSVVHDGKTDQLLTTAASVDQILSDDKVDLANADRVSQPLLRRPSAGLQIVVQRVTTGLATETQPLPFATQQVPDATLDKGRTQVVTPGVNGSQNVSYAMVYIDGVLAGKTQLTVTITTNPTPQVEKIGAKAPVAAASAASSAGSSSGTSSSGTTAGVSVSPGSAQDIARQMLAARGMGDDQFSCLVSLWNRESGWRTNAANSSGAYGIPQALPGSKMASAGPDWQTDPATQITWGLGYITGRYGTPCGAWGHSQSSGWY